MNFLCSVFGFQILLASTTVWAADLASPTSITDDQAAAWMKEFDKENDVWINAGLGPMDIPIKFEAEKFFRWSENGHCDKDKIDRSLNEAATVSDAAIRNLEFLYHYKVRAGGARSMGKNDMKNLLNILAANAQIWGDGWRTVTPEPTLVDKSPASRHLLFPSLKKTIGLVAEKYDQFLGNLTMERSDSDRVRLACSDKNVETFTDLDGKLYWNFKDFNIQKPIPEDKNPDYCASEKSKTVVWPDLIWICDDAWPKHEMTLKEMIDEQQILVEEDKEVEKEYPIDSIQLDDRLSLGGVMLHVLLHFFQILKEEFDVEQKYLPGSKNLRKEVAETKIPAWSYKECVALGAKDFRTNKEPKDKESIRNPQNFVWYGTLSVLDDVLWGKRAKIPAYEDRNRKGRGK